MSFGRNLERIRKDHHISQAKLGEMLGLTQQTISSYEKGTSSPNIEVLIRIANYFKISLDTLVGYTPPTLDESSSELRLVHYFHELTSSDKEKCLVIIRTLLEDREMNKKKC